MRNISQGQYSTNLYMYVQYKIPNEMNVILQIIKDHIYLMDK